MSIEKLKELIGMEFEDGWKIKCFHLYKDKINITLVNYSQMKGMSLTYKELEELFA